MIASPHAPLFQDQVLTIAAITRRITVSNPAPAPSRPRGFPFPAPWCAHQMLEKVETHISALRALLPETPDRYSRDATGATVGGCVNSSPHPERLHEATIGGSAAGANTSGCTKFGVAPLSTEARGDYLVAPAPPDATKHEHSDGLTEEEDMRLNRLLRSNSLSSPASNKRQGTQQGGAKCSGNTLRDEKNDNNSSIGSGRNRWTNEGIVVNDDDEPEMDNCRPLKGEGLSAGDGVPLGAEQRSRGGVVGPDAGKCDDSLRNVSRGYGCVERVRQRGERATGGVPFSRVGQAAGKEQQDDDLEDISDGGFHSGCWRRKYASGEMR